MPDVSAAAAPAPVVDPATSSAAPVGNGTAQENVAPAIKAWEPREIELTISGKKQMVKFDTQEQLTAVLQKALYADQVIKDATQAKKGAEALMSKLKQPGGLKEILADPAINVDYKKWAIETVREMMADEEMSPDQRENRDLKVWKQRKEQEEAAAKMDAAKRSAMEKNKALVMETRTGIIDAMKKYADIPQTQATMDAVIQNMRAGFVRFGKHLTPEQAMTVYSQQYWNSFFSTFDKMTPEMVKSRFGEKNGQKVLDKIQQIKLNELKDKTRPAAKAGSSGDAPAKAKKNMTEKEFDKHFKQLAGL